MTDDNAALVFNIERVDASDLRAQKKHDNREGGNLAHIRKDRTHRNKILVGTSDPLRDCEKVIQEHAARTRKDNRAPYDRIVLSASRSHFTGKKDLTEWARQSVEWLREEYGSGLAYAVAHLDEKTPHIHAVAVPLVDRGDKGWIVSHSQHPSHQGKNSYAKMRKRAANASGLAYGEAGGKPKAQALREAEQLLDDAKRQAEEMIRNAAIDARSITSNAQREAAILTDIAKAHQTRADNHQARNVTTAAALAKGWRSLGAEKEAQATEFLINDTYPRQPPQANIAR